MPKKKEPDTFMGLSSPHGDLKKALFVVLPVPYEATTTYGRGTSRGPKAIIDASKQVETFDEELLQETCKKGIFTSSPVKVWGRNFAKISEDIRKSVSKAIQDGEVPVILGGEHSITPAAVKAFKEHYKDLAVLQLDAHADLRDSYEGRKDNHACAMRRTLEMAPVVQAAIRNISEEEYQFAKKTAQIEKIHFAHSFNAASVKKILSQLSDDVYITIDADCFDSSIMPSTGTPEPGGFSWADVTGIVKEVSRAKKIVGFDLVELSPIKGLHAPDFLAAKLLYRIMGYIAASPRT